MRIHFFITVFFILGIQVSRSQTTVHKKIAQRSDEYKTSAWKGIDSFRWDYNSNAFVTHQIRLKNDVGGNWHNDFQFSYTRNANDSAISQVRQNWDGSNWTNINRYTYDYNISNELTDIYYETWNGSNWTYAGRYTYGGFNGKHKPSFLLLRNYISSTWVNNYRELYTYYPNDSSVMSLEKYSWNTSIANWDSIERLYYTYVIDSIGTITTSVPYMGSWLLQSKEVNSYAFTPLLKTSYFLKKWDTTLTIPDWVDERKTAFTYTSFDSISKIDKDVKTVFGWQGDSRTTFLYNANNRLSEYIHETYLGGWNYDNRFTRSYTGNNLAEEIQYVGLGTSWEEKNKFTFLYDALNLNVYRQKDTFNGASYFPNKRDFYYYNTFTVNTTQLDEITDKSILYPNPATDKICVTIHASAGSQVTIQILDALGKVRKAIWQPIFQGDNNIPIDISALTNGHYLLRIINTELGQQKTHRFQKK